MAKVVIQIEGGLIQEITADAEVDVIIADFDTEGAGPEDLKKSPDGVECYISHIGATNDPDDTERWFNAFPVKEEQDVYGPRDQ